MIVALYLLGAAQAALWLWYVNAFQGWTDEDQLIPTGAIAVVALCWFVITPVLVVIALAVMWRSWRETGVKWETRRKQ